MRRSAEQAWAWLERAVLHALTRLCLALLIERTRRSTIHGDPGTLPSYVGQLDVHCIVRSETRMIKV